jgi:hypothetical protein
MDGKSSKKSGIRFPIGSEYSGSRKKDYETQINPPTPLSQATSIQLTGFRDVTPSKFPSDNTDNIRGKVKYDKEGNLIYSLVIPLSKLTVLSEGLEKPAAMTLGIEYGVPPEMQTQSRPPSSGSNMKGGGGSRPSGGSRSGGGGSSGGSSGGAPKPQTGASDLGSPELFWIKEISLATKN